MLERKLNRFDHLRAERELDALHWAFGRTLHATDVDLVVADAGFAAGGTIRYEIDHGGITAVLDYKYTHDRDRWPGVDSLTWTRDVYRSIASSVGAKYYVVGYTLGPWSLRPAEVVVTDGNWSTRPVGPAMDSDAYGRWLWSMRGVHLPEDHTFPGIHQDRFRTADKVIEDELRDALVEDEACAEALMHFARAIKEAL